MLLRAINCLHFVIIERLPRRYGIDLLLNSSIKHDLRGRGRSRILNLEKLLVKESRIRYITILTMIILLPSVIVGSSPNIFGGRSGNLIVK